MIGGMLVLMVVVAFYALGTGFDFFLKPGHLQEFKSVAAQHFYITKNSTSGYANRVALQTLHSAD